MNPFEKEDVRHVLFEMLQDFFFDTRKLNAQTTTLEDFENFTEDWINKSFPRAAGHYEDYVKTGKEEEYTPVPGKMIAKYKLVPMHDKK